MAATVPTLDYVKPGDDPRSEVATVRIALLLWAVGWLVYAATNCRYGVLQFFDFESYSWRVSDDVFFVPVGLVVLCVVGSFLMRKRRSVAAAIAIGLALCIAIGVHYWHPLDRQERLSSITVFGLIQRIVDPSLVLLPAMLVAIWPDLARRRFVIGAAIVGVTWKLVDYWLLTMVVDLTNGDLGFFNTANRFEFFLDRPIEIAAYGSGLATIVLLVVAWRKHSVKFAAIAAFPAFVLVGGLEWSVFATYWQMSFVPDENTLPWLITSHASTAIQPIAITIAIAIAVLLSRQAATSSSDSDSSASASASASSNSS